MSAALLEGTLRAQISPQSMAGYPWFALRVKSNFERTVERSVSSRGFEAYLPTYKQRKRLSDRTKETEQPLFPGYVFCRLDLLNRLPILTVPGVVHIVGAGRTFLPVEESEIAAVQRLVQCGLAASPWPFLKVGQKVLIEKGPLTGIEGNLVSFRGGYRLVLSISLLQRSISAELDGDWVRPIV